MTTTEPELVQEMFVQTARGATRAGDRLTLSGLGPSTLYFSDRPTRVVGHMTNDQFADLWAADAASDGDGFASDPPNAVLSFVDVGDDRPDDCVVVLRDPRSDGDSVSYAIEILEGSVPDSTGACTLFIDPLGRPLSPVSVAGMRRRDRRRR
jgi:hypothetical protein